MIFRSNNWRRRLSRFLASILFRVATRLRATASARSTRPTGLTHSDMALREDLFKADMDLADRYQRFSETVLTLSLAGVAVYGFVFDRLSAHIELPNDHLRNGIGASLLMFGVAAAFAAGHRYLSSDSMAWYLAWLRFSAAADKSSGARREAYAHRATTERRGYRTRLRNAKVCLSVAVAALVLASAGTATVLWCGYTKSARSTSEASAAR